MLPLLPPVGRSGQSFVSISSPINSSFSELSLRERIGGGGNQLLVKEIFEALGTLEFRASFESTRNRFAAFLWISAALTAALSGLRGERAVDSSSFRFFGNYFSTDSFTLTRVIKCMCLHSMILTRI